MAPTSKKKLNSSATNATGKSRQSEQHNVSTKSFYEIEDKTSSALNFNKPNTDYKLLINKIRSLLTGASSLRKPELRDQLLVVTSKLRNLNRYSNFHNKINCTKLSDARQKIEAHYLSLQNATNEIVHLRKNIATCLEFHSSDADIELAGLDEFYLNMSEEQKNDVKKYDAHQLHLARLTYELNERKTMLANLQELEGRKSALLSDIRGKEQRLLQIHPKINSIKRSTTPLLELLNVKHKLATRSRPNHRKLQLRPIYINEDVCREIFGSSVVQLGVDSQVVLEETKMDLDEPSNFTEVEDLTKNDILLPTVDIKVFFNTEENLASLQRFQTLNRAMEHISILRSTILNNEHFSNSAIGEFYQHTIFLHRLNRHAHMLNRKKHEKLRELRLKLEKQNIALSTLTTQINYSLKSIEVLLDLKSSLDSDIELIPIKQFYEELPISVSRPDITHNDPHKLYLYRLKHELTVRNSLLERVQELERDKKTLFHSIATTERTLGKIDPRVENLKKIAKPLFDIVGLKSIASSVHNKSVIFRPIKIDIETDAEIFGKKLLPEEIVNGEDNFERCEEMEEWENDLEMQIDNV